MRHIRKVQWRLFQTDNVIIDLDFASWTIGVDWCISLGVYLGPLQIDIRFR